MVARTAYFLESWLYSVLYPGFQNEMPLDAVFQLKYLLPGLVVVVILELVLSAMMLRFGARTFSVMWLCFCFSFMILPRSVDAYMEGSVSFLARIGGVLVRGVTLLSPVGWAVVGGAVLLALLAFAVSVYRKAEVRL